MNILITPNALKGSLTAAEAADAIARGALRALGKKEGTRLVQMPVADGGDGSASVLAQAMGAKAVPVKARDALGRAREGMFYHQEANKLAIMDMASVCGLALLKPEEYAPLQANTLGLGDLILAALESGVEEIILGIGGSASTDGGTGMAHALGVRFLDAAGRTLEPGEYILDRINHVDITGLHPALRDVRIRVMCDVDNPLLGANGAAAIYAPQKGASKQQVAQLEQGLLNLAQVVESDLDCRYREQAGAGAAGGLGFGLLAFLGAELCPGVQILLDLQGFDQALEGMDLVITAEGAVDEQTAFGKAPAGVAERAKRLNIPCFCLCGAKGENMAVLHETGIDAVFSICPGPISLDQAMTNASHLLELAAEQAIRAYSAAADRK